MVELGLYVFGKANWSIFNFISVRKIFHIDYVACVKIFHEGICPISALLMKLKNNILFWHFNIFLILEYCVLFSGFSYIIFLPARSTTFRTKYNINVDFVFTISFGIISYAFGKLINVSLFFN